MPETPKIKIGELAIGIRGVSYRPEHLQEEISPNRTVLLRSTNIQGGRLDFESIQIVPNYLVKTAQEVREADLVVCMSNGSRALVGKAARFNGEYGLPLTVGAFCSVFHPKNGIDSGFLHHVFQGEQFRRSIDIILSGSAINNLKNSDVEGICITGHAPAARKKIADILDAIDDAIIETDALIAKRELIRTGLLDDLIALPAQIGSFDAPGTLSDLVGSISSGCSVNADDRPPTAGEYGVLKTSAVSGGRFHPTESKAVWAREVNRLKCPVVAGLILFSRMNTRQLVGENAYVNEDHPGLFLPDRLWAIRIRDDVEVMPEWVATILQTRQARAFVTGEATGTSGSMKNIARKSLLRLLLRRLPLSDQTDAVNTFRALQAELDDLLSERDKLAALRDSLRNDLLAGRVLVVAVREAAE
jgi:type I restriction enzyme, S subunit